ncbi:MAG: type II secretion system F family protein, partial [Pirellulales bacterium]|nr:type II secretion system F family protein [Pirellulales bacterium]
AGCLRAANDVAAGGSLGESLADTGVFPRSMLPLIDWGGRFGSLAAAIRFIAESFEGRTRLQINLAPIVIMPVVMIIIMAAGFAVVALFMPLVNLIECLS